MRVLKRRKGLLKAFTLSLFFLLTGPAQIFAEVAQTPPAPGPSPVQPAPASASSLAKSTPPPDFSAGRKGSATEPADHYSVLKNPLVAEALAGGGNAFYLGERSGLDGWILLKGSEVQTAYVTADRKTLIIGSVFASEGYDITADQITQLIKNNPEAAAHLTQETKANIASRSSQLGIGVDPTMPALPTSGSFPVPQVPASLAPPVSSPPVSPTSQKPPPSASSTPSPQSPPSAPTAGQPATPFANTAGTGFESAAAGVKVSAGEKLFRDLQDAAGVDLGSATAPALYMIMDPNCPHCKATWRLLRDAVIQKTLRVHLVPIGRNDEEERAAARLLRAEDPLNAWDKYAAGDKTALAGIADPKAVMDVKGNYVLIDSWSISETPYIVYRSRKSEDIKVISGEPEHIDEMLSDVSTP